VVQAVSCWIFTAEDRVQYLLGICGVCGGQSFAGKMVLQRLWGFPYIIIAPTLGTYRRRYMILTTDRYRGM